MSGQVRASHSRGTLAPLRVNSSLPFDPASCYSFARLESKELAYARTRNRRILARPQPCPEQLQAWRSARGLPQRSRERRRALFHSADRVRSLPADVDFAAAEHVGGHFVGEEGGSREPPLSPTSSLCLHAARQV